MTNDSLNLCRTLSVSITRCADHVYGYLANPESFPKWSIFIQSVEKGGEDWAAETIMGPVRIRFTERNDFRVLDHDVTTQDGTTVHVPMRVLPNGENGSEVIFSIFRRPDADEKRFEAEDVALVSADLAALKRVLEENTPV